MKTRVPSPPRVPLINGEKQQAKSSLFDFALVFGIVFIAAAFVVSLIRTFGDVLTPLLS